MLTNPHLERGLDLNEQKVVLILSTPDSAPVGKKLTPRQWLR